MKSYIWSVLICGFALILAPACGKRIPPADVSAARLDGVVKTDLKACSQKVPVIPQSRARAFPQERVEKTLNGIWRGRVFGQYDKQFLARDGFLNVDYYMIVDVKRREALALEQLSDKRAAPPPTAAAPPMWSFLMCGQERYLPRHPPQIHEFQKVSDNLEDARSIVENSTGLRLVDREMSLSAAWQTLVERKYFDDMRYRAYAGGLFKPFQIGTAANAAGTTLFAIKYDAEYRGGGVTAARFEPGVPIRGVESGQFVGVTTGAGDFLVSSLGNGMEFSKEASQGGVINMFFDKVVIGPLASP